MNEGINYECKRQANKEADVVAAERNNSDINKQLSEIVIQQVKQYSIHLNKY